MAFSAPDASIQVKGHKTELQQAVSNLIHNAIKYTPDDGQIGVVVELQAENVRFEVIDGYGIPEADQFNSSRALGRPRRRKPRKLKVLGPYIIRKLIDHNDCEIVFSSECGKGSVLRFTLSFIQE